MKIILLCSNLNARRVARQRAHIMLIAKVKCVLVIRAKWGYALDEQTKRSRWETRDEIFFYIAAAV